MIRTIIGSKVYTLKNIEFKTFGINNYFNTLPNKNKQIKYQYLSGLQILSLPWSEKR